MPPLGFNLGGDSRNVVELPDLPLGADGQSVSGQGQSHGTRQVTEMRVERPALGPEHDDFTRLICRDQHRGAQCFEQRREAGCVDAAQRRCGRLRNRLFEDRF